MRLLVLTVLVAALAWAPSALAGGQLLPGDDGTLATASPAFTVELTRDDVNVRVEVTDEDGGRVGSCVPTPTSCTLARELENGVYFWTLRFQNRFCDGYQGELCELVDREAGPRRFVVAVPRSESRRIVLGRAIGSARIGMTEKEAHAQYGELLRVRGATEVFEVAGGVLAITFVSGRAVALWTTSAYYRGPDGIGVGAKAPGGWRRTGDELVRGGTRLTVVGGRVVRVTVGR